MKHLLVLRHGKSDWGAEYGGDHERPLAARGVEAARLVGNLLAGVGQVPELVLSSTAVRARETARLALGAGAWGCRMETGRRLYEASAGELLEVVREQDDAVGWLLLAGHEPACSGLVAALTGARRVKFPTAALARLDLPVDSWSHAKPGTATLAWLVTPKLLRSAAC